MADSIAIDMHAHVLVPEVEALVAGTEGRRNELATQAAWAGPESSAHNRSLGAAYGPKLTDVARRLADMDAMGVDMQVICTSPTQYYYWAEPDLAGRIVAAANNHLASLVAAHPTRFLALAAVSLQHPSLAAEQLTHAVRSLGLRGVEIATRVEDRELSDEALDPFWAAAESLAAVVFIHPISCTLGERLRPILSQQRRRQSRRDHGRPFASHLQRDARTAPRTAHRGRARWRLFALVQRPFRPRLRGAPRKSHHLAAPRGIPEADLVRLARLCARSPALPHPTSWSEPGRPRKRLPVRHGRR